MRRAILTLAATLAVAAPAQAHTTRHLGVHQARVAATRYAVRVYDLTDALTDCARRSPHVVRCDVDGFIAPGDPGGPVVTCDGCADATGQEVSVPIIVRLHHDGRLTVAVYP